MSQDFSYDDRLEIEVPLLELEWSEYSPQERRTILERWEVTRGRIPAIIAKFEAEINQRHERLQDEENWDNSVRLITEVNDYASRINDLNILYRTQPDAELSHHDPQEHQDREK